MCSWIKEVHCWMFMWKSAWAGLKGVCEEPIRGSFSGSVRSQLDAVAVTAERSNPGQALDSCLPGEIRNWSRLGFPLLSWWITTSMSSTVLSVHFNFEKIWIFTAFPGLSFQWLLLSCWTIIKNMKHRDECFFRLVVFSVLLWKIRTKSALASGSLDKYN